MTNSGELRSGKTYRDENFPVAFLVRPEHRAAVLAFYEFVRVADDIADHPSLGMDEKLSRLDRLDKSLLGESTEDLEGVRLHAVLNERHLSNEHARDLLKAFRQDVVKNRYSDWADLIDYCANSAMPVGRYVLDVHGESRSTWPTSDALCAALQIINHLQDCASDYRKLDRVYLPLDTLSRHGASVEQLDAPHAAPGLIGALHELAAKTGILLAESGSLPDQVQDARLAMEIAAIQTLAFRLVAILQTRDPLRDVVHLSKPEAVMRGGFAAISHLVARGVPSFRKATAS
jgi:squalene synthase HpnC